MIISFRNDFSLWNNVYNVEIIYSWKVGKSHLWNSDFWCSEVVVDDFLLQFKFF